jgi:large subunit ribosomal protein L29
MTKATELRELNDAELVQKLAEAREEHFNLRFGDIRREVARINTLLREREIEAHEQQQQEA